MRPFSNRSFLSGALPAAFAAAALSCSPPAPAPEAPAPESAAQTMAKTRLSGRIPPVGPYSAGVEVSGLVFLAGQIALDHEQGGLIEGGITEQTHQVMQNLQAVLAEAGLGFGDVVRAGVFLADVNDFAAMNEVYALLLPRRRHPAGAHHRGGRRPAGSAPRNRHDRGALTAPPIGRPARLAARGQSRTAFDRR